MNEPTYTTEDAFEAGRDAWWYGEKLTACPHGDDDAKLRDAWRNGWHALQLGTLPLE